MFTFEFYRELIERLFLFGYGFEKFDNYASRSVVYLRHDVDCDHVEAYRMAVVEREMDVFATYLFQPDSDFYNMQSSDCRRSIEKIHDMGHDVGLHIDASTFRNNEELTDYINRVYSYFADLLPIRKIFSFHRPALFQNWRSVSVQGFINTYEEKYFTGIIYVSDSNRHRFWEGGFPENTEGRSVQFLTHPLWWDQVERSPREILWKMEEGAVERMHMAFEENVKLFRQLLRGEENR